MCDPLSLVSAGMSVGGGFMQGADAMHQGRMAASEMRSMASFEAAQADAQAAYIRAQGSEGMSQLHVQMREATNTNIAAMAVSGLAPQSFDAVTDANEESRKKGAAQIERNVRLQENQLMRQKRLGLAGADAGADIALSQARNARTTAIMSGMTSAAFTLYDANTTWASAKSPSRDANGQIRRDESGEAIPQTRMESIFEPTRLGRRHRYGQTSL